MGAQESGSPGSSRGQASIGQGVAGKAEGSLSRGDLLRRAAVAGAAVASTSAWAPAALAAPRRVSHSGASQSTLVVGVDAVGSDLIPAHAFQGWGHTTALTLIFESLYGYPNQDLSQELVPVLASALPRRDKANPRKFAVDLRKGVVFHDGTKFDADAVVFNFMRFLDKTHPFYDPAGVFVGNNILFGVAKVEALDSDTVVFTVNRPLGDFKSSLFNPLGGGMLSPTAIKAAGVANAGLAPAGTGPYKLIEAKKGDRMVLERFDGYRGPKPSINRIVFRAIPDSAALTAALLSGDVHMSWLVGLDDAARFEKDSKFNMVAIPSLSAGYIGFNTGGTGVKTFADQRVRLAAMTALNKQKLIALTLGGRAAVGAGLNPPASWAYQAQLKDFHKYNPTEAKRLLSQVGSSNVPDVTLSVPSNAHWPRAAESVQADWNAVGLKTSIKIVDVGSMGATMTKGLHDVFMWDATPASLTPWALFRTLWGCGNQFRFRWGGYCDQDFDRALLKSIATTDRQKTRGYIETMDKKLLEGGVWQANYYPSLVSVWRKNVTGFKPPAARFAGLLETKIK